MKVKELIEKLQEFDQELEVKILDQEFGIYEPISNVSLKTDYSLWNGVEITQSVGIQ